MTPFEIWTLCQSCAESVYGRTAPTPEYADRTARLLFGTCAVESNFTARRQYGFAPAPKNTRGAFGLWQVELATLRWMMDVLRRRPDVQHHLYAWLGPCPTLAPENAGRVLELLQTSEGDRLACALARLRYFVAPGAIPAGLEQQAAYWLDFYNGQGALKKYAGRYDAVTARGLAIRQYTGAWARLCAPIAEPPAA